MSETTGTSTRGVSLSDAAASKIRTMLDEDGREGLRLRVGAQPGGCSGVSYQLYFDDQVLEGDVVRDVGAVDVVVDRVSASFLADVTIDFSSAPGREGFTIGNPNAGGGGGCCG